MLHIQILGLGCPRCTKLAQRAEAAAQRLGEAYRLEKVNDLTRILEFGVPVPALVINGVVRTTGTLPTVAAIQEMLYVRPRDRKPVPEPTPPSCPTPGENEGQVPRTRQPSRTR